MSARRHSYLLGLAIGLIWLMAPALAQADFGIHSLSTTAVNQNGSLDLQAGSHPFEFKTNVTMNQDGSGVPEGTLRDLIVDLPAGLAGNPQAVPTCPTAQFEGQNSLCPAYSQVGVARIFQPGFEGPAIKAIYNLAAPLGVAARIGFSLVSLNSFQEGTLNPANNYGITISDITIPTTVEIQSIEESIWGVPADPKHNPERFCQGAEITGCASEIPEEPFLSLPTNCSEVPRTFARVDSLQEPGNFPLPAEATLVDESGEPALLRGCESEPFQPTLTAAPETTSADSPTGLHVGLKVAQTKTPNQPAAAHLKDASVTLPAGLAVNPSAATGLGACALEGPEGINLPGSANKTFEAQAAKCPANSKVGTVAIHTPLLDHQLNGDVYLARQGENPFGSLIALYIAVADPISGVVVKIPGEVQADNATGQLTATFKENPQLPFEELDFDFTGGPRATLTTPLTCGTQRTEASLTPWSTPEGKTVFSPSSFPINSGCASSEAGAPNAPTFEAGTANPLAGSYSPFVLKLSRENGSQHFGALNLTLPQGVSAKLAGVAECSDAQIAAAAARSGLGQGAAEQASPSCPASSEVGTVTVGAGSGTPFYVGGHAYLAGPYKGAPLSIAIIVPAVAGPFDLGVSVVRSALYIDETSAQVTVKSDPLPSILHGIPVDVRSVAVKLDRSQFSLNPTSCEAKSITGEEISTAGAVAKLQNRFQVGGCRGLDFSPKIAISFKGGTKRAQHPALSTTITRPEGQANFGKVSVTLPASQFIDQNHIGNPCTRPKFAEGKCPRISELGTVTAYTPLLDKPLKGKVYFRANGGERTLPDIVADLNGQIHFVLVGFVDSIHKKGSEQSRVRATFAQNPDAPVSKVLLNFFGGKRGVLVNSQNLCTTKVPQTAIVKMAGQNGKEHNSEPKIANSCPKKKSKKKKRAASHRGH